MEEKIDLRVQKTYIALHNAFTQLLEKYYFEEITVNELCDTAMIRRTTFYKHFNDKYDYFKFYLNELISSQKKNILLDTLYEDPLKYTEKRLYEHLGFMRKNKKLIRHLAESNMMSFMYHAIEEEFKKELTFIIQTIWKEKPSPQQDFLISMYAGGLIAALGWWIEHPDELADREIAKLLVNDVFHSRVNSLSQD